MENKAAQPSKSIGKRDPGFVKIRRGLRPHLRDMSGNATKLYLWLHLSADFRTGDVDSSYEDIARALGWGSKTLQRAIDELSGKYIGVELAANQHELTRISIWNYQPDRGSSGVDKSVQTKPTAVDSGVDIGVDKSVQSAVHSNPVNQQIPEDLQAPKKSIEVKNEKNGTSDAVRRRFDSELPLSIPSSEPEVKPSSSQRAKLEARLAGKIESDDDRFSSYVELCKKKGWAYPFGVEERAAFKAAQYEPDLSSPLLSLTFVMVVVEEFEKCKGKNVTPGNLCSKVIDHCMTMMKRSSVNSETHGYYWPPDFKDHRDRLRERERGLEQKTSQEARA
jgi:hypothetical protein